MKKREIFTYNVKCCHNDCIFMNGRTFYVNTKKYICLTLVEGYFIVKEKVKMLLCYDQISKIFVCQYKV